jgi:tetratricopeptide (TPR) repeat protein
MRTKLLTFCCAAALAAAGCTGCSREDANRQATQANANSATAAVAANDIGKLDADIARLEAQAAKDPDDRALRDSLAEAFVRRGNLHLEARRLDQALSDFKNALSHRPDYEEAQERITQISNETQREPVGEDGRPVTVPAAPGTTRGSGNSNS